MMMYSWCFVFGDVLRQMGGDWRSDEWRVERMNSILTDFKWNPKIFRGFCEGEVSLKFPQGKDRKEVENGFNCCGC